MLTFPVSLWITSLMFQSFSGRMGKNAEWVWCKNWWCLQKNIPILRSLWGGLWRQVLPLPLSCITFKSSFNTTHCLPNSSHLSLTWRAAVYHPLIPSLCQTGAVLGTAGQNSNRRPHRHFCSSQQLLKQTEPNWGQSKPRQALRPCTARKVQNL